MRPITCERCSAILESDARVCARCGTPVTSRWRLQRLLDRVFPSTLQLARPLTLLLVVVFLVVALAAQRWGKLTTSGFAFLSPDPKTAVLFGASFTPAVLEAGHWWRLVTAIFLHFGALHLLFNGKALWDLGPLIEAAYGPARFLTLFVVTGAAGFAVSLPFAEFTVGASGALFGFIGALLGYGVRRGGTAGAHIKRQALEWLLFGAVFGYVMPGINNWAHGGGAVAGFLLALLFEPRRSERERESLAARLCGLGSVAVVVASAGFAAAFAFEATR